MDNRISQIRTIIWALRITMRESEDIMRAQINRDEDCSFVAGEILKMRHVMSELVRERTRLGDNEPILVNPASPTRRPLVVRALRPAPRRFVSAPRREQAALV